MGAARRNDAGVTDPLLAARFMLLAWQDFLIPFSIFDTSSERTTS
jgi:hypothetical protein